jgi:hypothetical protein
VYNGCVSEAIMEILDKKVWCARGGIGWPGGVEVDEAFAGGEKKSARQ